MQNTIPGNPNPLGKGKPPKREGRPTWEPPEPHTWEEKTFPGPSKTSGTMHHWVTLST